MAEPDLSPLQQRERDILAAVMCREAARGRAACYSCRSGATRLVLSGCMDTAREHGVAHGRRVVPDPQRFPARLPDYAMRTAQGHPPIPEEYRWSPPQPVEEDYSI